MAENPPTRRLSHEEIREWYVYMHENRVAWCAMKQAAYDANLPGPGTVLEQIPWLIHEINSLKEELVRVKSREPLPLEETEEDMHSYYD